LFLSYKELDFVQAARAAGAGPARIMFRHILPNTFGPIMVETTLNVGFAIILESTLSFLGQGVPPPTPTLGNLMNEAKGAIDSRPYELLFPGAMVMIITLCVNFLGDGMRDALDPTSRRVRT
jgi:ABC-type dipeptide/oligopeptide/nickel transport system permease subunit